MQRSVQHAPPPPLPPQLDGTEHRRAPWDVGLVFGCCLLVLVLAAPGLGVTWDESIYFRFSDSIREWVSRGMPLERDAGARFWAYSPYHNPHPPLMKILSALTAGGFASTLGFPGNYRLATHALAALVLTTTYALLARRFSRGAALLAVLFVMLQPRVFGELLIATTDGPTVGTWLAVTLLAWAVTETADAGSRRRLRSLLFVVFVIGVCTKVTAALAGLPAGIYYLSRRQSREALLLAMLAPAALIGVVLVSPDKWSDPLGAIGQYLWYPLARVNLPITTHYFGKNYNMDLPLHYFDVMSLATYPVPLWLCLPGLALARGPYRSLVKAMVPALALWLVLAHLPWTPRHDGVRQFASAHALLAVLSWAGWMGVWERLRSTGAFTARWSRGLSMAYPGLLLAFLLWRAHPHELSYYNALVGGIRGAEALGFELTYYFDAIDPALVRFVSQRMKPGERLMMYPYWPMLLGLYQREGLLRRDIETVSLTAGKPARFLLLYRRRSMMPDDREYLSRRAVYEVRYEGVSLVKVVPLAE